MKIERISSTKLKIVLSSEDAEKWDINLEHLSNNSPEVQELFWSIMKQAERECDFYADGSQLFIEAVTTRTDGFIFVVTKLEDSQADPIQKLRSKVCQHPIHVHDKQITSPIIFEFPDFDSAVSACKQIGSTFHGDSTLYKYQGKYYLSLHIETTTRDNTCGNNLLEYGSLTLQPRLLEGTLSEHGEMLIPQNAVESFCAYF